VELEPLVEKSEGQNFVFVNKLPEEAVPDDYVAIIEDELKHECLAGGLAGYPLTDIRATLLDAQYKDGESNEQAYRFAVAHAVRQGLEQAGVHILEPIMKLEVVTPDDYLGEITADLGSRRAAIHEMGTRGPLKVIIANAPLREMFGYSTKLRSLSQGRATYSMEPLAYEVAPDELFDQIF
jgi:elongation factor G